MKTLIIDGNNLIHRTFYTAKTQSKKTENHSDYQVNNFHIYFTLNAVSSYVKQFVPDNTIFVWDEKKEYKPNIRKSILKEYKGNRSKDYTPHQNNEVIKSILYSMGINSIFPSELEADDIVSYICREHEGDKVIISVDRDFLQLVCEECMLYDPIRKKYFDIDSFTEETGYENVEQWFTAKCLTGDKSDNVPGIPRFGKASVKRYFEDPSYMLDDKQREIFKRNVDIFCLDKYESLPEEKKYYKEQLAVQVDPCYKTFLKHCEEHSFKRILDKKEDWHNLFFMKSLYNKLNDIAS